jgi:sulfur carrier protein ThiS
MMINITIHLHTILQRQTPDGLINLLEIQLPADSTLADLLRDLNIELEPEHLLLAVNGRVAELDQVLQGGDQVNVMPALSGGSEQVSSQ